MREIPILFSSPMVRALLDGTKTQTRRPLYVVRKFSASHCFDRRYPPPFLDLDNPQHGPGHGFTLSRGYDVGDRLWVRETWHTDAADDKKPPRLVLPGSALWFSADSSGPKFPYSKGKLRPSMFMPRWASRITLEVTGVRVERLNAISEEDCIAEGIEKAGPHGYGWRKYTDPAVVCTTARQSYGSLWESINGPGSLDLNPWVWVVSFRRV